MSVPLLFKLTSTAMNTVSISSLRLECLTPHTTTAADARQAESLGFPSKNYSKSKPQIASKNSTVSRLGRWEIHGEWLQGHIHILHFIKYCGPKHSLWRLLKSLFS